MQSAAAANLQHSKTRGRHRSDGPGYSRAVAAYEQEPPFVAMQVLALFIEFAIVSPNVMAATAIAEPTIARISAYSAAEAPDWSFSIFMKLVIESPF